MMKLLIYPPVDPSQLATLEAAAGDLSVVNAADETAALREIVDAECFYGKLTRALLVEAERLRWVQAPTASLEHYVFPELIEHECTLTNMRGLYSDVIADQVLGYIVCFARNLHTYIRQQMEAKWAPIGTDRRVPSYGAGQRSVSALDRAHLHLGDCTIGIVGLGSIGAEIGARAAAFGMRVIAVDPVRRDAPPEVESLWDMDRLDDLLAASHFVVVAAPHTPTTEGLFRRAQFQQMNAGGYFINIGRGAIVSLDDLVAALRAGEIAGAALDVYEIEPLPSDHPLWRMPNVILTPHVAGASVHIAKRHVDVLTDNLRRFTRSRPLVNVVDKAAWF